MPYKKFLRFQNPTSPHLTLQFWREVMEIEYVQTVKQTEKIAEKVEPFTLTVTHAETFGDRVLILKVAFSDELARLRKLCPWVHGKPYSPHITLARMSHMENFRVNKKKIMKILKDVECDIPVDRLRLYAEVREVNQTPIKDFPFVLTANC